ACTKIALACAKICFEIFGCARQSSNKFDSALACAKIREISATDQVAMLLIERDECKFLDIFGCARHSPNKFGSALACTKIREIRGQKNW
ncbi:MAG: hypothetical protein SPG28_02950, partial [Alloprevotella sp.]|nr:hypothetical protein [Alloprevotella sp.]